MMKIRQFIWSDEAKVLELWQHCELVRPWNDPHKDIQRKMDTSPQLFMVGVLEHKVMATVMAGYDGHHGWINYLAVDPVHQRKGYGRTLIEYSMAELKKIGCPKLNIQIRTSNHSVIEFYRSMGFAQDHVISMGKRLIKD